MFRSLHIGVDKYADRRVPWLSGAVRDAQALHALFSDTFGAESELVADDSATADGIRNRLAALASDATEEDIVVITYAGHGSNDHYLIPFDCDVSRFAETCISLDEFSDLISAIPGAMLFCALDCCFAGGLGARVFCPEGRPRAMRSPSSISALDRFVGDGRIVLTAAADDQEAMESARHGHGLFTFRLLEALQGAQEVREGDQVNLYEVIRYVTERVTADALQMGHEQTPTLRGQLDGAPLWPILVPGTLYAGLFPGRVRPPATSDPSSLVPFGIPESILNAWSGEIPTLNSLQLQAINDFGVLDGNNLVVTAPTSSGKTLIGELAALKSVQSRQRSVFLLPMRALVNDKFEQFTRIYGPLGLRTIRVTGEHSDNAGELLRGQFDIALLTYESYAALVLGSPHVMSLAALVVVDEAQMLTDRSRGSNLEFVMTLLNERHGRDGVPQIITLSAVVGSIRGLDRWLGARHLASTERPVPLVEGVLENAGTYHSRRADGSEHREQLLQPLWENGSRRLLIPLVQKLRDEGKKVIVFRQSKAESIACAVYLSQAMQPRISAQIDPATLGEPSTSSRTLVRVLDAGVAFHNADLNRDERRVVEEMFRDPSSALSVVVATPTLAMGVNTPAAAVAIVGLTHPGLVPTPYSVAEYKNMVGRAGRLGFTDHGESYLIPEGNLDASRAWSAYVNGQLEDLHSQLVTDNDPRTLILRIFASQPPDAVGVITEERVLSLLEASFAAFQARLGGSQQWDPNQLQRAFAQLATARLIEPERDGYRLSELGRFTGQSGVHVDSIVRLATGLRGISQLNSVGMVAAVQLTNELNDVYMPVNAKAVNTEVPRWPGLLRQQGVPEPLVRAIQQTARDRKQSTERSKRAAGTVMWMNGVPMDAIEQQLNQHMRGRPGLAGTIRASAERARDLLPAVAAVMRELDPSAPVSGLLERTQFRLEVGIPSELVDLASIFVIQPSRTEWMRLYNRGIYTVEALRTLGIDGLVAALGSEAVAHRIWSEFGDFDALDAIRPDPLALPFPAE